METQRLCDDDNCHYGMYLPFRISSRVNTWCFFGVITVEFLGTISGISAGGGLLGLGIIIYQVIKIALKEPADFSDNTSQKIQSNDEE